MDIQKRKLIILSLNILSKAINDLTYNNLESESDSEDEIEKLIINEIKSKTRPKRRRVPRIQNYFEDVVPRFSSREFQMHFRMPSQAFEALCQRIIPIIKENYQTGHPYTNLEKKILSVI